MSHSVGEECRRCKVPRGLNLSGKEDRAGNRYAVLLRCFFMDGNLDQGYVKGTASQPPHRSILPKSDRFIVRFRFIILVDIHFFVLVTSILRQLECLFM